MKTSFRKFSASLKTRCLFATNYFYYYYLLFESVFHHVLPAKILDPALRKEKIKQGETLITKYQSSDCTTHHETLTFLAVNLGFAS